jgi:hypothetical protein
MQARNKDGRANRANKGGRQCGVYRFAEIVPADFGQIGERDADNQCRFNAFPQRDDECLEHGLKHLRQVENEFQFQYG